MINYQLSRKFNHLTIILIDINTFVISQPDKMVQENTEVYALIDSNKLRIV